MAELSPGIHRGVAFDDYLRLDAVDVSLLKLFRRTPAHAYFAMTNPGEETSALRTGDACHAAILEPERFALQYVCRPKFDMRTIKGKKESGEWDAANIGKANVLHDEWLMADSMRKAVWQNPIAAELLSGAGQNEMTAIWKDPPTGLLCKGRMDRFTTYQNWTTIADVKSAQDASFDGFSRACQKFAYHWQAAFYLDGLNVLAPLRRRFIHIVVEKEQPYLVRLFEMEEPTLEEGRRQYRRALNQYAECKVKGEWPGYPVGIEVLNLPKWAYELVNPES